MHIKWITLPSLLLVISLVSLTNAANIILPLTHTASIQDQGCQLELFNTSPYKVTIEEDKSKASPLLTSAPRKQGYDMLRTYICLKDKKIIAYVRINNKIEKYISRKTINTINRLVLLQYPKDFQKD